MMPAVEGGCKAGEDGALGERLKVDLDRVREVTASLEEIKREFDAAEGITDGYRGSIGSGRLADKLDEFSDNWRIHRKRLTEDLQTFTEWSRAAVDAYKGVDDELAKALRDNNPENGD
jgi:hypothetical protein